MQRKSTLALRFGAALLAAVCVSDAARADAVRVLAPNADGTPEETTLEGKIESTSADAIVLAADGQKRTLAAASVLGTQYDDEPIVLAAARADLELGKYEDALAKLAEISAADVRSSRAEVRRNRIAPRARDRSPRARRFGKARDGRSRRSRVRSKVADALATL